MIVFDLEWNSGQYEKIVLNEILQIGAVRVERPGGQITGMFNAYIRPTVHKRYAPPVKELPELERCEASELDFPTAIRDFLDWCGQERIFATWGEADFRVLRQNLSYWKLEFPYPETYIDLQAAFDQKVGAVGAVALYRAVEYCRIPDIFAYHNSANDALYSALVSEWLSDQDLREAERVPGVIVPKKKGPGARGDHRQWFGPFGSREEMLNNRGSRLALCPVCGNKIRVSCWVWGEEPGCYARFSCPEHGRYLLRLEARAFEGGLWSATKVLEANQENQAAYGTAKEGESFQCKSKRAPRRRRRSRQRAKVE